MRIIQRRIKQWPWAWSNENRMEPGQSRRDFVQPLTLCSGVAKAPFVWQVNAFMRTLVSAVAFAAIVFVGCNNDFSRNRAPAGGDDLVLRAHFIGSEQLLRDKSVPKLVEVWNLKSSVALRNDALNKFSRLPAVWMGSALPKGASDNANLFRPILEDALVNESFVEWHASSFALLAKL